MTTTLFSAFLLNFGTVMFFLVAVIAIVWISSVIFEVLSAYVGPDTTVLIMTTLFLMIMSLIFAIGG